MTELALEIKDLTKTYSSGVKALDGISLEVKKGDFFALLGPNGAGKSTTIGILSSLVNKTSGSIRILGVDIDKDQEKAKSFLGIVPQEFNFSIFEPVEQIVMNQAGYYGIPRKIAQERAAHYLELLTLTDKSKTPAGKLSGGMKRRLMIARALVHEPEILILDEPTAGVDIEIRRSMWDFLENLNKSGKTIILTTHYLEEAETLCRNLAIIDKGKIIENTSIKKILESLTKETFIIDFQEEQPKRPMSSRFSFLWQDDKSLEVQISKSESINELFQEFSKLKLTVSSLRNKSNRLEELFLNLVKRK